MYKLTKATAPYTILSVVHQTEASERSCRNRRSKWIFPFLQTNEHPIPSTQLRIRKNNTSQIERRYSPVTKKSLISPPPRLSFPSGGQIKVKVPAYRPTSQPPSEHHAISVRPFPARQTAVPKKIRTPATCRRSGMIHACRSVSVRHKSTIHRSIPRSASTETSNRYTSRQHAIPETSSAQNDSAGIFAPQ